MSRTLTGILMFGICVILGIDMLSSPIIRYRSMDVDLTGFNKPLGIVFIITGLLFLTTIKKRKGEETNFIVGKYQVIVKKKNKSWGALNSLDLYLHDGQFLTFYCTTDKVSATLLDDFILDQNAELEIKTRDGQECELMCKNAYAHGAILLKSNKENHAQPEKCT
jgi:hypothetical protein